MLEMRKLDKWPRFTFELQGVALAPLSTASLAGFMAYLVSQPCAFCIMTAGGQAGWRVVGLWYQPAVQRQARLNAC